MADREANLPTGNLFYWSPVTPFEVSRDPCPKCEADPPHKIHYVARTIPDHVPIVIDEHLAVTCKRCGHVYWCRTADSLFGPYVGGQTAGQTEPPPPGQPPSQGGSNRRSNQ